MNCPNCGVANSDANTICLSCGASLTAPVQQQAYENANATVPPMPSVEPPVAPAAPMQVPPQNYYPPYPPAQPSIPENYKPLSAWAYVGYNLLFSIPLVGFILMIVFAVSDGNINRRNYARSFFCAMLIGVGIAALFIILAVVIGLSAGVAMSDFSSSF